MDALREWFAAITGIIILTAIGEAILPSGAIKKYVRMLFGLILVITVCSPFVNGGISVLRIEADIEEVYTETQNMDEKERETVLRLYKANLSKKIAGSLEGIAENCDFEVGLDIETQNMQDFGKLRGVTVTVKTEDTDLYINDEIEEIISHTYGVLKKNIAIKYIEK